MRLLCVADHTSGWPQDVDGRYELGAVAEQSAVDALLSLGDYSPTAARAMARSGIHPMFGVYGNHCTADYMPEHGIVDLVGDRALPARITELLPVDGLSRPVSVLAVQGCVKYREPHGDVLFTQEQYAQAIDGLPPAELVVTHCPPSGINDADDAHRGIEALRRWMDRHRPRWLIHGHTYGNPPVSVHGDTTVFWIDGVGIVDLPA